MNFQIKTTILILQRCDFLFFLFIRSKPIETIINTNNIIESIKLKFREPYFSKNNKYIESINITGIENLLKSSFMCYINC